MPKQQIIDEVIEKFEKDHPPFKGIGARHPIFNETPVYTHITQFIEIELSNIYFPKAKSREIIDDLISQHIKELDIIRNYSWE